MNEFQNHPSEYPSLPEFHAQTDIPQELSTKDILQELASFFTAEDLLESTETTSEYVDEREYGLRECVEAAKEIFTPEVISEWGRLPLETRNEILQDYQHAIADSLGIERGQVIFEEMDDDVNGYNNGDGNVYLNIRMLADPRYVIGLIDVVAHETRHQFQHAVVENPGRFGISQEVANEWAYGMEYYTDGGVTQYDPWGYHYNPLETDARYFGEAVVRELTKDLINEAGYSAPSATASVEHLSFGSMFIDDREWHIQEAEKAIANGDLMAYREHLADARRSTK